MSTQKKQQELVPVDEQLPAERVASMQPLIELAKANVPIETMRELVNIYREERAYEARTAFDAAFAAFKAKCPPIKHDKSTKKASDGGSKFSYTFASLAEIARVVDPLLTELGFSYSWDTVADVNRMTIKCTLWHKGGHSRQSDFVIPIDNASTRTVAQNHKSTLMYGQRCSLISVLGLSTTDTDLDGGNGGGDGKTITEAQARDIEALILEVGADRRKVLAFFGVESIEDLAAANYQPAVKMLEQKRGK